MRLDAVSTSVDWLTSYHEYRADRCSQAFTGRYLVVFGFL